MSNYIRYSYAQLEKFCNDCFEKFGFSKDESKIISDHMTACFCIRLAVYLGFAANSGYLQKN